MATPEEILRKLGIDPNTVIPDEVWEPNDLTLENIKNNNLFPQTSSGHYASSGINRFVRNTITSTHYYYDELTTRNKQLGEIAAEMASVLEENSNLRYNIQMLETEMVDKARYDLAIQRNNELEAELEELRNNVASAPAAPAAPVASLPVLPLPVNAEDEEILPPPSSDDLLSFEDEGTEDENESLDLSDFDLPEASEENGLGDLTFDDDNTQGGDSPLVEEGSSDNFFDEEVEESSPNVFDEDDDLSELNDLGYTTLEAEDDDLDIGLDDDDDELMNLDLDEPEDEDLFGGLDLDIEERPVLAAAIDTELDIDEISEEEAAQQGISLHKRSKASQFDPNAPLDLSLKTKIDPEDL